MVQMAEWEFDDVEVVTVNDAEGVAKETFGEEAVRVSVGGAMGIPDEERGNGGEGKANGVNGIAVGNGPNQVRDRQSCVFGSAANASGGDGHHACRPDARMEVGTGHANAAILVNFDVSDITEHGR